MLQTVSWAYIWLFRSVPLIVLLLFRDNFSALYEVLGLGVPVGLQFVRRRGAGTALGPPRTEVTHPGGYGGAIPGT